MKLFSLLFSCMTLATAVPLERRAVDCATAKYKDIMLTGFNTHRANNSVADLTWNKTLAGFAKTTSTTGTPGVHDSAGKGYGQNLYWGGGAGYDSPGDAISSWYNDEIENYNTYGDAALIDTAAGVYQPDPATPGAVYGHYTQVVWKNTATVGCHTASRDDLPDGSGGVFSGTYTVCDFYPPGNWVTSDASYKDNVLEPLGQDVVGPIC